MNETTVLIIDDSALVRSSLTEALSQRGYAVATASNGNEGLCELKRLAPDVILMDVVMPIMDGWETCRQIRSLATLQSVPIIIMTHKNTPQDLLRAFEVGANEFLEKPVDHDQLATTIDALVQQRGRSRT